MNNNKQIELKRNWKYMVSQYVKFLMGYGNKFIYFLKWAAFNFGFQFVVVLGK